MSSYPVKPAPREPVLVVVVDADESVRRNVRALLDSVGARVRTYATAREFLESLTTEVPRCVVANAHLPGLPGLTLLQELRARGLRIPTILLADEADIASAVAAMRAGAVDYIEKPYIDRALATQVSAILDANDRRH